jgi:hypothetical protein
MIDRESVSTKSINQRMDYGSLPPGLRLTFFAVVALAGSFLLGWLAAEAALEQLLFVPNRTPTAEQIAGLMLLGLAALLVLVRLDHTCGICRAFQMALAWLQRGGVDENG